MTWYYLWFVSNNLEPVCVCLFLNSVPSASELPLTPGEWNVTIGFEKVEWATQILVKVSRLTVNSSAPKPHFPLHRFSESGVRGLVKGGGGRVTEGGRERERERGQHNNCGFLSLSPPLSSFIGSEWEICGPRATPGGCHQCRAVRGFTGGPQNNTKTYLHGKYGAVITKPREGN